MEQYEPNSSELEVSTRAGDGAEDLEIGKGEGGPREGAEDAGPREGDNCSRANGVDRQHWFLGQLNALSNDLLHDLVETRVFSLAAAPLAPISSCICSMVSSSLRLWIGRRGNSLKSIGLPLFLPLIPAFLLGRRFDLKFVNGRMTHIFSQKP